ncbi:MAG: NADH-quinone oxidoreductase subunit N, partial [Acidobacteriota bacterium]
MSSPLFSWADVARIAPELWIAGMAMVLLVVDIFVPRGKKMWLGVISLLICIGGIGLVGTAGTGGLIFSNLFSTDAYSSFFKMIFLVATLLTILMSIRFLEIEEAHLGEYYFLLLAAVAGMMFMAAAVDLIAIYISLETMAIACYVLTGFFKRDAKSNEAAMKYFLLGAFASGILLYGMALVYGLTGSTNLYQIAEKLQAGGQDHAVLILGMLLILSGLGFKVAAVPFHMWAPDIYQGAPTPVTGFLSVGPKAAYFSVFLRICLVGLMPLATDWKMMLAWISFFTMAVGNIGAIVQTNVKRLLAYSSIAHVGYLLMGLLAGGDDFGIPGVLLYLFVYVFMNLGAFGIVIYLRSTGQVGDEIEHFQGLAQKNPWAAGLMIVFLLSLTGIPPTAGFVGKYFLFAAAVQEGWMLLAVAGVVFSAVSLYYYFKIAVAMYMGEPTER